jgi:flagellar biosynthesis/type III secretory pathway chaperone
MMGDVAMEGIAPNLEELVKNLKHQLALYRQLVDLLREEKEHLIKVSLKEVRECTYSKEALLDEIHREEFRRKKWNQEAAAFLQMKDSEITMEIVATKIASTDQFESLMSLKLALQHLVKKAAEMNVDNKALIESALKDANQLKKNILGLTSDMAQVYGPKGNMGSGAKEQGARFFNKEA